MKAVASQTLIIDSIADRVPDSIIDAIADWIADDYTYGHADAISDKSC